MILAAIRAIKLIDFNNLMEIIEMNNAETLEAKRKAMPAYTDGIIKTLKQNGISIPDPYAWHTYTDDNQLVCIMEADHRQREVTKIDLKGGYVIRNMNPDGHADKSAITQRHARQLFDALTEVYEHKKTVKILLIVNARYSRTPERQTRAMLLPWNFSITEMSGGWIDGYRIRFDDDFSSCGAGVSDLMALTEKTLKQKNKVQL